MSNTIRTTTYLQLEPEWSRYGNRDEPSDVMRVKVVGHTQRRSKTPRPGTVEVAITIEIPKGAFVPLRPEAVIVIPEDLTIAHEIQVEATDPNV